jgi:hypothetical protein
MGPGKPGHNKLVGEPVGAPVGAPVWAPVGAPVSARVGLVVGFLAGFLVWQCIPFLLLHARRRAVAAGVIVKDRLAVNAAAKAVFMVGRDGSGRVENCEPSRDCPSFLP